ncbi:arsenic resistance protein [Arthrobacter sp. Sa2CUA1]|uniref:Arsenic resistance protein n=1 Tax=Arthrobacter gallicola TaxID=2762225 RepID=A0ABR8UN18_9MICC|nr:bile acid:sodium symporter [Arthrobacter gallicola]MBD7993934.1 arsenic resistance protein [Arthrobacter gallicola]
MTRLVEDLERHQIPLYLLAIVTGGLFGWLIPAAAEPLEISINPVLGLLLFATFLGIPFAKIGQALRDVRFMATVMILNFLIVPVVVFGLSRFVAHDQALLIGVMMVLLTPCIDYVIVFSGLAGGSSDWLLAAAPLLMLTQMLLLPLYLLLFIGPELVSAIEPGPFIEALVVLIIIPLMAAALTQWWARRALAARHLMDLMQNLMVPLMMLTLAVVIGSQIVGVGQELRSLLAVVPIYVAFLIIMVPVGMIAAHVARLDVGSTTAVVFSGATRNSLVVLPLALALPEPLALVALVVVTQTLVELIGMVTYVKALPRLIPRHITSHA